MNKIGYYQLFKGMDASQYQWFLTWSLGEILKDTTIGALVRLERVQELYEGYEKAMSDSRIEHLRKLGYVK